MGDGPMPDVDWHGWRVKGHSLHVGYLPGRKQPVLYSLAGGRLRPLAYFKDEELAREALAILDDLVEAKSIMGTRAKRSDT